VGHRDVTKKADAFSVPAFSTHKWSQEVKSKQAEKDEAELFSE
jgi:hypothetical protein